MKISVKRKINAPSGVLWNYLGDYSNIHRFHPLLKDSNFIEGAHTCEVGSTRQCDMKDGGFIKEKVIDWQEGSHYTIDVYETSMPIKNSKATMGVTPLGEKETEVYMNLEMTPKYKILQPIMFLAFKYIVGPGIFKGLEKLYEEERKLNLA